MQTRLPSAEQENVIHINVLIYLQPLFTDREGEEPFDVLTQLPVPFQKVLGIEFVWFRPKFCTVMAMTHKADYDRILKPNDEILKCKCSSGL